MARVELLGHYGGDETHALSAWTSTKRQLTPERKDRIDKMLGTLARDGHHTPFEKSFLHFLVEADTASHIHLLKHRIGVSVNAESARYKQMTPRHYLPDDWTPEWRAKLDDFAAQGEALYAEALTALEGWLGRKRAKESARYFLTYANDLTLDVGFNFRSFMHFLGLRNEEGAQLEINQIASQMLGLVRDTEDFTYSLAGFGFNSDRPTT